MDSETLNKRITRSSKQPTKVPEQTVTVPRKKKAAVPAKKTSTISNKEPTKSPGKRGRPKSAESNQKVSKSEENSDHIDTVSVNKVKNSKVITRGRGIGNKRGNRGRVSGGISRAGKKPAKSFYYWGSAPPTADYLAAMGAADGCTYALTTKGRIGARNRRYMAQSRSWRAAELAVQNLYDSD